jgi:hypothetical protein
MKRAAAVLVMLVPPAFYTPNEPAKANRGVVSQCRLMAPLAPLYSLASPRAPGPYLGARSHDRHL